MKSKYLIILISTLFLTNSSIQAESIFEKFFKLFSDDSYKTKAFLQIAPTVTLEDILLEKITDLNSLGKSFKYYKELSSGLYTVDINQNEIIIKFLKKSHKDFPLIFSHSNKAVISVPLEDIIGKVIFSVQKFDNYYSIQMKDADKNIVKSQYLENLSYENLDNPPLQHTYNKPRILIDKEIGNLSSINPLYPNLGKILNKNIARQRTRDPQGNPADIFADITAGTFIPFPLGIGQGKVFIVDKIWNRIIMMDRDIVNGADTVAYAYPQYPIYSLSNPTDITTGAKRFKNVNSVVVDSITSLYVAENTNGRIVRLDFVMQYNWYPDDIWRFTTSYVRDQSFRILNNNCVFPYSISLHAGVNGNPRDSLDDKLWFSEGTVGNKKLVCMDAITGARLQEVTTIAGLNISPSRLSVYRSPDGLRNLLAFVEEMTNSLVVLKLEPTGLFINSNINVRYFQDFGFIKLKSVLLSSYNNGLNGTTIWTVGDGGEGGCGGGGTNCGYVSTLNVKYDVNNFPTFVNYLATIWSGSGSSSSFVNLQNVYGYNGYLDLATIEKWTNDYGLRKYKPGIDTIGRPTLSTYCTETDRTYYTVNLTNPSRASFSAEYKPINGQWTPVPLYVWGYSGTPNNIALPAGYQQLVMSMHDFSNRTDYNQIRIFAKFLPTDESFSSYNPNHLLDLQPIVAQVAPCNTIGGCPFLFVKGFNGFVNDNNILHRSEFDQNLGRDIEDKYLLRVTPQFNQNDSTCELKIKELNNDISYFDKFSLVAVDHPVGTSLGVSENGDYVLYYASETCELQHAQHEEADVTPELAFDSNDVKTVDGLIDDNVTARFDCPRFSTALVKTRLENQIRNTKINKNYTRKKNNSITDQTFEDSVAIIIDPSALDAGIPIGPPNKRPAGVVTAYDAGIDYESPETQFAQRQNRSTVIIPVGKNVNIDSVYSIWTSDFSLSYLTVTPVFFGGYAENFLELIEANDSISGDVLSNLATLDEVYATLDSTTNITLRFKNIFGNEQPGFVRDYILITNGRYENVNESDNLLSSQENQSVPTRYKLQQNFPNPFNPTTKINFEIPKVSHVNIIVYDIIGKEVTKLINNELKQPGRYHIEFDGKNIASGVYFYRLETSEFIQTKRMVLIK